MRLVLDGCFLQVCFYMPADTTLSDKPSARHGNGDAPYVCSGWDKPARAEWSLNYTHCRHSLEPENFTDKRCPKDCKHRAPELVALKFHEVFKAKGAIAAAEAIRETPY